MLPESNRHTQKQAHTHARTHAHTHTHTQMEVCVSVCVPQIIKFKIQNCSPVQWATYSHLIQFHSIQIIIFRRPLTCVVMIPHNGISRHSVPKVFKHKHGSSTLLSTTRQSSWLVLVWAHLHTSCPQHVFSQDQVRPNMAYRYSWSKKQESVFWMRAAAFPWHAVPITLLWWASLKPWTALQKTDNPGTGIIPL